VPLSKRRFFPVEVITEPAPFVVSGFSAPPCTPKTPWLFGVNFPAVVNVPLGFPLEAPVDVPLVFIGRFPGEPGLIPGLISLGFTPPGTPLFIGVPCDDAAISSGAAPPDAGAAPGVASA